ncbi:MAG: hypothetical protein HYX71_08870 [Opitutae bacterium]|nr:hypothetical protein [Opitutae bacterium]
MLYGIKLSGIDLVWSILIIVGVLVVGFMAHFRWITRNVLIIFLLTKLVIGLGSTVWLISLDVEFDAAGYYRDGQLYADMLTDLFKAESREYLGTTPFWTLNGTSTDRLGSLTGLFLVLVQGSFLGATAIACLFGAVGQLLVYRYFRERFPQVRPVYFLPILFHPSFMLWSGMLLKDSFGIFGLGGAVYALHILLSRQKLSALILLLLYLYSILLFRSFIFLPLAALTVFMFWDRVILLYASMRREGGIVKILYLMAGSAICASVLWTLAAKFGDNLVEDRREGAAIFSQIEAGSSFENTDLSFSPSGILSLGIGATNCLFRPLPWDVTKPIQAAAALENLVVVCFVVVGFHCYLRRLTSQQREQFSGLFWGMLMVALIIATGVGLFASNSGTISRYRIPMIPFLVAVPCLALGMADYFVRMRQHSPRGVHAQQFKMARPT